MLIRRRGRKNASLRKKIPLRVVICSRIEGLALALEKALSSSGSTSSLPPIEWLTTRGADIAAGGQHRERWRAADIGGWIHGCVCVRVSCAYVSVCVGMLVCVCVWFVRVCVGMLVCVLCWCACLAYREAADMRLRLGINIGPLFVL